MKIRQIHNSKLAKLIGYNITLYPFVLYIEVPTEKLIKHEMIHVEQIKKIGVIRFYVSYIGYYICNRLSGTDHMHTYKNIPYEIEAYKKQEL